jgi:hypothetical protein
MSAGSATTQATVALTFNITELAPRKEAGGMPLIAGFILLGVSEGGAAFGRSMIAGRVVLSEESPAGDSRVYAARLELVHVGQSWALHLYYRHEDVHFWDRKESLEVGHAKRSSCAGTVWHVEWLPLRGEQSTRKQIGCAHSGWWRRWWCHVQVGDVVRLKENKQDKDKWLTRIPLRFRQILHPHYTAMFTKWPAVQLIVPHQPVTPDVALPWCEQVATISSVGRVRGELGYQGFVPGEGWVPSNCMLRHYWNASKDDTMWNALKSNIRIRMLGDSNFGHIADDGFVSPVGARAVRWPARC